MGLGYACRGFVVDTLSLLECITVLTKEWYGYITKGGIKISEKEHAQKGSSSGIVTELEAACKERRLAARPLGPISPELFRRSPRDLFRRSVRGLLGSPLGV